MQTIETEKWQDHIEPLTRWLLVGAGFIQGLFLYLLIEFLPEHIPNNLQFIIFSLLYALFWMFACVTENIRDSRLWLLMGAYGLILSLVAFHVGGQCSNDVTDYCGRGVSTPYIITQSLCWCLLSIVIRSLLEQRSGIPAYPLLFKYSWHNFFVVVLTGFYVGLFWTLLILGARLFSLVGIDLFWKIIFEPWFIYPVSGTAIVYGATVVRQQLTIVTTLYRALHTVIGGLLPMLALISVCFLVVLPFTGLQPLWDTRISAWLLLWLAALLLFFTNASIQYGDDQHWPGIWRLLILSALVLLPIYLLLAGYSLWLRIDQYGLTSVRVWGVLACLILSGYSLCYAIGIVVKRSSWTIYLGRINATMLGGIIMVLILTNTPFLYVQKIVAENQVERLLNGTASVADFDQRYLMHRLGKPGKSAIKSLVNDPRFNSLAYADDLAEAIEENRPSIRLESLPAQNYIEPIPEGLQVPELLNLALNDELQDCVKMTCYVVQIPLKEGVVNFVLLKFDQGSIWGTVYQHVAGKWEVVARVIRVLDTVTWQLPERIDLGSFTAALKDNDIQVVEPEWKDIQIGDTRLRIE